MDVVNDVASLYNKQIQLFFTVIILGYFGIKIIYGFFFNYYPYKYYYRNITINSSDNTNITKNVALNAFIPGMWNNELTDFITCMVMSLIVFSFTYSTNSSIFLFNGTVHPAFLAGYILGLGYPAFMARRGNLIATEMKTSCMIRYIYLITLAGIIGYIVILNYTSEEVKEKTVKMNMTTYFVILFLVLFGLVLSKKNSKNYEYVTYQTSSGNRVCSQNPGKVIIQSSGDVINIQPPFAAFILLLLFCYQPAEISNKFLYIFLYGLFMGIFVSGVSYFGVEYFLAKMPQQEEEIQDNVTETDDNSSEQAETYQQMVQDSFVNSATTDGKVEKVNVIKVVKGMVGIFLILILIYFVYISIVKKI